MTPVLLTIGTALTEVGRAADTRAAAAPWNEPLAHRRSGRIRAA